MNVIEFAMKMEKDGKAYYEKLSRETDNPELKKILIELAEEEERHYQYFSHLKSDPNDTSGAKKLKGSKTLALAKNIFEQLAENSDDNSYGKDVVSAWTQALRNEEKSEKFYREAAAEEHDKERKNLLLKIAQEENNHVHMVSGIIMYLKAPMTFADSSQFKEFRSIEGWGKDLG